MAIRDIRSQRLFVEADLREGIAIAASREQSNYLLNVLRLKSGAKLLVFNGRDGEWLADIVFTGRKSCDLIPLEPVRAQPPVPSLIYCFAPLKQARLDYMIQKAVEMGVGTFQPVITQFTQVRTVKRERLLANAIEAAEQCGILTIPEFREPVAISKLKETLSDSTLVICDEQAPDAQDLDTLDAAGGIALLVGPEGGFSDEERAYLNSLDDTAFLGLGPRTLRADTAAIAALAILQSKIGDWYQQTTR